MGLVDPKPSELFFFGIPKTIDLCSSRRTFSILPQLRSPRNNTAHLHRRSHVPSCQIHQGCSEKCKEGGFTYYGLENGYMCSCNNALPDEASKAKDDQCSLVSKSALLRLDRVSVFSCNSVFFM